MKKENDGDERREKDELVWTSRQNERKIGRIKIANENLSKG